MGVLFDKKEVFINNMHYCKDMEGNVRSKEIKLDLKDKKILCELDLDSRKSISDIAKNVKMSKQAVEYRINNLLKEKVISNFYAVVDMYKLGYTIYRVALKFQNISLEKEQEFSDSLRKKEGVGSIITLNGKWDMAFFVLAKNIIDFEKISSNAINKYGSYISDKFVSVITALHTFRSRYLYEDAIKKELDKVELVIGNEMKEEKIDEGDIKILKLLSVNARTPLIEIATKSKMSPKTAKNKIKSLIGRGIICGFKTSINGDIFEYDHYKVFLYLQKSNDDREKELLSYLRKIHGVVYCTKAVGICDIEFEIKVKSVEEFYNKINQLKRDFPNLIKDYESLIILKEELINYFPF